MNPHTPPTQAELDAIKGRDVNCQNRDVKTYGPLSRCEIDRHRLITEVERLRAEYQAAVEDHNEEMGEFQNAVREEIIKLTGAPDSAIDGKGSDAGWDEFTLAEISQGIGFLKDRLTKEVEELRKDSDNLHKDVVNLKAIAVAIQNSPQCSNCGKPATCFGRYEACEDRTAIEFACSECCGHCNEGGRCIPVLPAMQQKGEE